MSLLYDVLFAWKCSSTHHKLALDALRHLRGRTAPLWHNLFLSRVDDYLKGAKAPDNEFKDFRNHVLHVREGYWGGATVAAERWYEETVQALAARRWMQAAYNAGVLSHYFTDPFQPFHTGQSEAEGAVHRAAEWSIAQSYETLQDVLKNQLGGYPAVEVPAGDDWLTQMIRHGAHMANPHYEVLIDHYDLRQGVKNPPAGLDDESRRRLAFLIGQAAVGFARVLDRALADAQVAPPPVDLTLQTVFESLNVPVRFITKKLQNASDRRQVERMYAEYCATGKVIKQLPEDDKVVRRLHAEEVLHQSLSELDAQQPRLPGTLNGTRALDGWKPEAPLVKPRPTILPAVTTAAKPAPATLFTAPVHKAKSKAPPTAQQFTRTERVVFEPRPTLAAPPAAPLPPPVRLERAPLGRVSLAEPFKREQVGPAPERAAPALPPAAPQHERPPKPENSKAARRPSEIEAPGVNEREPSEAPSRYYLELSAPVADGPSIGPKTAKRLEQVGIRTVSELLAANPSATAGRLKVKHITADVFRDWQDQAALMCRVPNLRGHDAQILVACNVRGPEQLATANEAELFGRAEEFANSAEGQRLLRQSPAPDRAEVRDWISWAGSARGIRAA